MTRWLSVWKGAGEPPGWWCRLYVSGSLVRKMPVVGSPLWWTSGQVGPHLGSRGLFLGKGPHGLPSVPVPPLRPCSPRASQGLQLYPHVHSHLPAVHTWKVALPL